uniref:Photosystem I reaction center subunit Nic-like isoform X2 n=1 Tax=Rhizophora mucronata TaxID=61149 RepID=A0A2P2KSC3_RHIMU
MAALLPQCPSNSLESETLPLWALITDNFGPDTTRVADAVMEESFVSS